MFRDLLAAVRAEASGERARDSVAAVSRFHRVQSSPGFDAAAAWLAAEIEAIGLTPERDEVPGDGRTRYLGILMPQGWECARARAVLEDGGTTEVLCDTDVHPLTVVLRIPDGALLKNHTITKVWHNADVYPDPLSLCGTGPVPLNGCLVANPTLSKGKDKIWTITVRTLTNGWFTGG